MYCLRPAESNPHACTLWSGSGEMCTPVQAGGMASERILPSTSSAGTGRPSASTNRKPSAGEPTRSHQSLPRDRAIVAGEVHGLCQSPPFRPRAGPGRGRGTPGPGRAGSAGAALQPGFAAPPDPARRRPPPVHPFGRIGIRDRRARIGGALDSTRLGSAIYYLASGSRPHGREAPAMRDLRFALRSLARRPGLLATTVLSLAFGIGVNVVLYGVVNVMLFRPPPRVAEPERIVRLEVNAGAAPGLLASSPAATASATYPQFEAARAGTRLFSGIAADALKGAQRSVSRSGEVQGVLVAVQIAACGALLTCGGLYVRSLHKALAIDPGFAVLSVHALRLRGTRRRRPGRRARERRDGVRRRRVLPRVRHRAACGARLRRGRSRGRRAGRGAEPCRGARALAGRRRARPLHRPVGGAFGGRVRARRRHRG